MKILDRNSNTINIATFWENYQLKKYDFSPNYQRPDSVWTESKRSFLIDTILKNFPMPPIFLHQHIDIKTGKTIYDVIDGKQRLTSIIDFIKGNIFLPEDFGGDGFGDEKLNGLKFSDLENLELTNWKKNFWKYEITIEYVDTDKELVVNNIFDRLNRNGSPLKPQELRNAKYNSSFFYALIKKAIKLDFWKPLLANLETNRLEDQEFISELLFVVLENQIFASDNPEILDNLYEKYIDSSIDAKTFDDAYTTFEEITRIIDSFQLDYEKYKISGVSHLYGIFCLGWVINNRGVTISNISNSLDNFYTQLRQKDNNPHTTEYQVSMNAGTKSRARRIRRVNSLLGFLNQEEFEN
jgi:uncharacterized protein with ParB-like and HNH nuclease domain